jgi:hypothetical protein
VKIVALRTDYIVRFKYIYIYKCNRMLKYNIVRKIASFRFLTAKCREIGIDPMPYGMERLRIARLRYWRSPMKLTIS